MAPVFKMFFHALRDNLAEQVRPEPEPEPVTPEERSRLLLSRVVPSELIGPCEFQGLTQPHFRIRYRAKSGLMYHLANWGSYIVDDGEQIIAELCIIPTIGMTIIDKMVAQYLMVKHDEKAFLDIANYWLRTAYWDNPVATAMRLEDHENTP